MAKLAFFKALCVLSILLLPTALAEGEQDRFEREMRRQRIREQMARLNQQAEAADGQISQWKAWISETKDSLKQLKREIGKKNGKWIQANRRGNGAEAARIWAELDALEDRKENAEAHLLEQQKSLAQLRQEREGLRRQIGQLRRQM